MHEDGGGADTNAANASSPAPTVAVVGGRARTDGTRPLHGRGASPRTDPRTGAVHGDGNESKDLSSDDDDDDGPSSQPHSPTIGGARAPASTVAGGRRLLLRRRPLLPLPPILVLPYRRMLLLLLLLLRRPSGGLVLPSHRPVPPSGDGGIRSGP